MLAVIRIPGADAMGRNFLTWTPVEATARLREPVGSRPVRVTLRNAGPAGGGRVVFATTRTHLGTPTLTLRLPTTGAPVRFFVAGQFGRPSVALGDVVIQVRRTGTTNVLGSKRVTVRVRKNAQTLSPAERDRFVAAFATLNGGGGGRFSDFRDMHVSVATAEAHGNVGFLPWHRAYLLDLERELQAIDARVTLPYWRFDQPAPNLFAREFMGVSNAVGRVEFSAGHPFDTWRTDGALGISRTPFFSTASAPPGLRTELETIALGGAAPNANFANFGDMEGDPHGSAHVSFSGFISAIPSAARDPLFFLLHTNVDRLWAKWQWVHRRTSAAEPRAFAASSPPRIGHNLADTMWPWNGVTGAPRPPTAPGGTLPRVAGDDSTRPQPDGARHDRLPGSRGWPAARVRLRRRAIRAVSRTRKETGINIAEYRKRYEAELAKAAAPKPRARAATRARTAPRQRSAAARVQAIETTPFDEARLPEQVAELLATLRTRDESPTVRLAALRSLAALDFLGPRFAPFRSDYKQALRDVATDPGRELRWYALELLAIDKDPYAQELLVRGLNEPKDALVPDAKAIQLLSYDDHSGMIALVRRIYERSKGPAREEALRFLATDPQSEGLFTRLLKDKSETRRIRRISASGLQSLNPDAFERAARAIVADEDDDSDIRATSLSALAHGREVREKPVDPKLVETVQKISQTTRSRAMRSASRRFLQTEQ